MISERGMAALRCGAALVATVPQVQLRIRADERVLADVARPPFLDEAGPPQIPVCVFHTAVAKAFAQQDAGQRLRFMSLPDGVDPTIDIGVPSGDKVLHGGIVRVALGGRWMHIAPVAREIDACLEAIGELSRPGLGCHPDPAVGVTLIHAPAPIGDEVVAAAALDQVEQAVARCAVADLEDHLRAVGAGTAGP